MPPSVIESALLAVLDKRNHPMLVHCNKGKVRLSQRVQVYCFSIADRAVMNSIELVVLLLVFVGFRAGQRMIALQSELI